MAGREMENNEGGEKETETQRGGETEIIVFVLNLTHVWELRA